jgi:hypothetical protein
LSEEEAGRKTYVEGTLWMLYAKYHSYVQKEILDEMKKEQE